MNERGHATYDILVPIFVIATFIAVLLLAVHLW